MPIVPSLVALGHRNFRLLWLGQLVSTSGSMMQTAAILWHVSLLAPPGKKALALGAVGLVRIVPIVVLSLVAGVLADAADRRKLLLLTQSVMALLAGTLAWLTLSGQATLGMVYGLAALTSAGVAFDGPARQSLIPSLVPREHLPNAISLSSIMFQAASMIGPGAAGITIAWFGVGAAYAVNAVSFLAVILSLLALRDLPARSLHTTPNVSLGAALDGLRFVFRSPLLRSTMLLDFFATFFSSATALLPLFAQDVLAVGPRGYGWLYAAPSVGAVVTSLVMVPLVDRIERRGRAILVAVAVYGAATIAFGLSTSYALTLACLMAIGAADTVSTVLRVVVRHLETPDHLRGRMTSVNMVFFMGGPQLGELEAGLVANAIGAPLSVVTGGAACLLVTGWIAWSTPLLRRYRREAP